MSTYTAAELAKAHRLREVTPNGIAFDWWLVNSQGAGFALFRAPQHTDADIAAAKSYLRRERDVLTLKVSTPEAP